MYFSSELSMLSFAPHRPLRVQDSDGVWLALNNCGSVNHGERMSVSHSWLTLMPNGSKDQWGDQWALKGYWAGADQHCLGTVLLLPPVRF